MKKSKWVDSRAPGRLELAENPSDTNVLPLRFNIADPQVIENELIRMGCQASSCAPNLANQLSEHLWLEQSAVTLHVRNEFNPSTRNGQASINPFH